MPGLLKNMRKIGAGGDHRKGTNFFAALVQSVTGQAHIPNQIS
jgi:hypothetical protein